MGIEQRFSNQDEHEKQIEERFKKEQELERELMPFVVEMVEKKIKEQGISEDEISRVTEELKSAGSPNTDENLREEAIAAWKEETIDLELGKQVRERLEK